MKRYQVMTIFLAVILSIGGYGLLMNVKNDKGGQPIESHSTIDFQYNSKPDYYTEKYRTQYHLSPETGNMSDPNGMVFFEGEYHQFYQNQDDGGMPLARICCTGSTFL
jgi:fructan beta-fructosidase